MASLIAIRRATFKVTSLHSSHSIFSRNANIKTLSNPNQSHNDQQQYHATHSLQKHNSSDTQSKGLKKTQGFSTITLHNKTEYFYNGNYSHDQSDKISKELQNLLEKMKVLGYVPNVDEKKQRILTSHSERLAVVYGIINTKKKTPISVFKNLRVCADCHDAMKFISEITERKITVTDSYKVHHFQNGECSCDDF
ncbi:Pentatricopeptide repeat-containing protein [Artemisia annua]|uniref:Pentatricopeptide repeat-containing protein n=1 Tax=Artemisia annua TaxID=35608 RepID=A0A2U1PI36_ARTAN|nr:Pentatricopeptide repeat-containing protein [Artemisia annua]